MIRITRDWFSGELLAFSTLSLALTRYNSTLQCRLGNYGNNKRQSRYSSVFRSNRHRGAFASRIAAYSRVRHNHGFRPASISATRHKGVVVSPSLSGDLSAGNTYIPSARDLGTSEQYWLVPAQKLGTHLDHRIFGALDSDGRVWRARGVSSTDFLADQWRAGRTAASGRASGYGCVLSRSDQHWCMVDRILNSTSGKGTVHTARTSRFGCAVVSGPSAGTSAAGSYSCGHTRRNATSRKHHGDWLLAVGRLFLHDLGSRTSYTRRAVHQRTDGFGRGCLLPDIDRAPCVYRNWLVTPQAGCKNDGYCLLSILDVEFCCFLFRTRGTRPPRLFNYKAAVRVSLDAGLAKPALIPIGLHPLLFIGAFIGLLSALIQVYFLGTRKNAFEKAIVPHQ